jgi:hypothetical protein
MPARTEKSMVGPDQWLEIGALEIYEDTLEYIDISALGITLLSSDQKEGIKENSKLDKEYVQLCKAVTKGENVDDNYAIQEGAFTWKVLWHDCRAESLY